MDLMDKERCIQERMLHLEQNLLEHFEQVTIQDRRCFRTAAGMLFFLTVFPKYEAIVIEYAENEEDAVMNRFEDGDLFCLDELDESEMLRCMLREIGDETV